eukprot:CAMPEP_0174351900 /NCGR_PEP_ID=MMETSP0811_2-20130205/9419_1 /TAXON_ID=73025 ORGANISM="Eutreptiella gymnastica-like, Strain CCMP1594" /NCGR_SAMPLE_ID=MMETSP0811_2 /ASSEMBLY_ACC=CAM_ASM_000667 /LENGTH=94 /DNA_ID=CAMNT_0015481589 /DNA_START=918 /DNA_END=1200 /DNA_ORIENTATION=+
MPVLRDGNVAERQQGRECGRAPGGGVPALSALASRSLPGLTGIIRKDPFASQAASGHPQEAGDGTLARRFGPKVQARPKTIYERGKCSGKCQTG